MAGRRRRHTDNTEHERVVSLDTLSRMRDFEDEIIPILQKALREGKSREEIEADPRVHALLAAKQISIAIREQDTAKSMAAIKDFRDRTQGKAIERTEVKHKYEALSDEELDALLTSEAESLTDEGTH